MVIFWPGFTRAFIKQLPLLRIMIFTSRYWEKVSEPAAHTLSASDVYTLNYYLRTFPQIGAWPNNNEYIYRFCEIIIRSRSSPQLKTFHNISEVEYHYINYSTSFVKVNCLVLKLKCPKISTSGNYTYFIYHGKYNLLLNTRSFNVIYNQ